MFLSFKPLEPLLAVITATTGSWDVVRSVLEQYAQQGRSFERVMMLQPTSPLRTAEDIRNASALMDEKQAESVVGVCEADHSPVWSGLLPEDGNMNGFLKEVVPRQQIPVYYRINGAVYLRETGAVMSHAIFVLLYLIMNCFEIQAADSLKITVYCPSASASMFPQIQSHKCHQYPQTFL